MIEEHVPAQVTREEAQHYILLTLDRFRVMTLHLADNKSRLPSALNGNEGGLDLLYELEARDFYSNLMFLYTSDIFEVLSSEGLRELLLKCRELSDRFCLKVRIPADIRVVGESLTSEPTLSQAVDADKESLWDSFLGALQGEFNEEPSIRSIFIDMGLNLVPIVGQAMDARDIIACLDKLVRQKRHQEIMVWVTLVLTAIGCVPGAGDVIKSIGKAIIKGADDITIALLKKLDAEDIHTAFVKFRQTLQASTEEAVATINVWLKKAENRYKQTELAKLLSTANECMDKAVEFVQAKVDEFGWKVFGREDATAEVKLIGETDGGNTPQWSDSKYSSVWSKGGLDDIKIPQGISAEMFSDASKLIKESIGYISDDIVVQGSRASGTAKPTSDIDIAVRVTSEKFDELIQKFFGTPNLGSAKERTMLHAIKTGKIQSGEAKLKGLRLELEEIFRMEVDISIIKQGGTFDNPPFIPFE